MRDLRRQLRRDQLTRAEGARYLELLLERARENKKDRRWWDEALVVALTYLRDPAQASEIANEALRHFPADADMKQRQRLAQMWPSND